MLTRGALLLSCWLVPAVALNATEGDSPNTGLHDRQTSRNEPVKKPLLQWETLRIIVGRANVRVERSADNRFDVSATVKTSDGPKSPVHPDHVARAPIRRALDESGRIIVIEDLLREDRNVEQSSVEIGLRVPRDVWLEVEMDSGTVLVSSGVKGIKHHAAQGRLKFAGNLAGRIECDESGQSMDVNLRAASNGGDIALDVEEAPAKGNIFLATDGGQIEVSMPSKVLRLLALEAPVGGYSVDLPGNKARGKGRIKSSGTGSMSLKLSAKSGSVSVVGN